MGQNEFTAEQNRVFEGVSSSLVGLAIGIGALAALMIAYGVLGISRGHFGGPVMIIIIASSVVALILAWQFTRPLDNFRAITTTAGRDMSELTTGLDDLCRAFTVFLIVVLMWIAVLVVGIAVP